MNALRRVGDNSTAMYPSRDLVREGSEKPSYLSINNMAPRIQPSLIKNKVKRQEVSAKQKKAVNQQKLKKRLARAKEEASDPASKKVGTIVLNPTNLPIIQFYDRKE